MRQAADLERDIEHPCPSLCFGGSAQKIRELGQRRLRAECPLYVSLGTTGPGDRALTRQFLEPLFLVVSTRERRHEGNQVGKLELLGIEPAQISTLNTAAPSFVMRAPISGNVVQNQALRGSAVNPGDVLYSLGTLEDVWITGDIYEDDLARVKVGQQLEAVTTAYPDEVFHGMIGRISPNIDPNTHTLQIRCEVRNPGARLKPQMLARVKIVVQPGAARVVPLDALIFDNDSYFAYVQEHSVQKLHDAGMPIHVGTDTLMLFVVPGASMHEEMHNLLASSFSVEQVWAATTRGNGELLREPKLGTIQEGAPADLIVFRQDPTRDLVRLDTMVAVIADGRLYEKAELDSALEVYRRYFEGWLYDKVSHAIARVSLFPLPRPARPR